MFLEKNQKIIEQMVEKRSTRFKMFESGIAK